MQLRVATTMIRRAGWIFVGIVLLGLGASRPGVAGDVPPAASIEYPTARRAADVDVYHSVSVTDPYRWLEDPASPETRAWLTAQKQLTSDFFTRLPARDLLRQRLTTLWDFQRCGLPEIGGDTLYFQRVDGLQTNRCCTLWAPPIGPRGRW